MGEIPPKPEAGVTTSSAVSTFAINTLFLGESDRNGHVSINAWKLYGYDLDGLVTTKDSAEVCTLLPGAPRTYQIDGDGGIDNAWGDVLMPILQFTAAMPSSDATGFIDTGAWTLLLQVTGLSTDAKQTAIGLDAQVFVGASTTPPTFDTTTDWPVRPSSLNDGSAIASGAVVHFRNVYVTNGTLVAIDVDQPLDLPLMVLIYYMGPDGGPPPPPKPAPLRVRIHHAVLTFDHIDSTTAANGTIAGVLDLGESLQAAATFAHIGNAGLCGTAFDGIAQQIEQAQDILADETNAPGVDCNAISIGIGFTARLVANPTTVGTDPPPPVDPCPSDAGTE